MKNIIHADFKKKTLTPVIEIKKEIAEKIVLDFNRSEIPNHRLFMIDGNKFFPKKHGYAKFKFTQNPRSYGLTN